MTQKGIEIRKYVGIFLLVIAIFCSFGTFGGALSWASSPDGGGFYWIVTLIVAVAFVAGLISMYQQGRDLLEFYEEIKEFSKDGAIDHAKTKCVVHLEKSKRFQKHWLRKTCTKN